MHVYSFFNSQRLETCNFVIESLVNRLTAVLRALWAICNIVSGDQEQMLGNIDLRWVKPLDSICLDGSEGPGVMAIAQVQARHLK